MPVDGDKSITLSSEDLKDPTSTIERIFDYDFRGQPQTSLTTSEANKIIDSILCPTFELLPLKSVELEHKRRVYGRLLKEQSSILNFLEEQPFAAISGVAGTGKTLIAVEKARRHAQNGDKVLFLCFNKYLCDHLKNNYKYDNVSYFTIDAFACSICRSEYADFEEFEMRLSDNLNDQISFINNSIKELLNEKINNIVILTCSTEEKSILSSLVKNGTYSIFEKEFKFTIQP